MEQHIHCFEHVFGRCDRCRSNKDTDFKNQDCSNFKPVLVVDKSENRYAVVTYNTDHTVSNSPVQ